MSQDLESRWAELEARAARLLEHAKEVEPRGAVRLYGSLLRLWHFPAFAGQKTWTILQPGRKSPAGSPMLVRELTWDRKSDEHRFEAAADCSPTPNILLREAALPTTELQQVLDTGANLTVPIVQVANVVGLEGEYFGLETYEVSPSIRLQWWNGGPTEWRHFTDWVGELRSFLLRCLDEPAKARGV